MAAESLKTVPLIIISGSFLQHIRCSCGFIMIYSSFTTTSSVGLGLNKTRIGEGSLFDLPHMSGSFLQRIRCSCGFIQVLLQLQVLD